MRKNRRVIIAYVIPTLLALFLSLSAEGESIWAQWDESNWRYGIWMRKSSSLGNEKRRNFTT